MTNSGAASSLSWSISAAIQKQFEWLRNSSALSNERFKGLDRYTFVNAKV